MTITQYVVAQNADNDSLSWGDQQLDEVQVTSRKVNIKRLSGAQMGFEMGKEELFRAACCNLGESFQNNPSVDVNYSDATTGAKQIRLLGLSGTYVQMLSENQPDFLGAAKPFSLSYVPGPWMKSISVSKGASTVKNGFDGIAGQINVQYLQPEDPEGLTVNIYGDNDSRIEANADANVHIAPKLATEILAHYDENWGGHDDNGDTFMDKPNVRQFNLQNRWYYANSHYIFHGGIGGLKEDRTFGQTAHHTHAENLWTGKINTERWEAYMKHAFILNKERGSNIALMANYAVHNQDNRYGNRMYDIRQRDLTAQLMYETNRGEFSNWSFGTSYEGHWYDVDHLFSSDDLRTESDHIRQRDLTAQLMYETNRGEFSNWSFGTSYEGHWYDVEHLFSADDLRTESDRQRGYLTSSSNYGALGIYGQYTLNLHNRFVAMLGLRGDLTTHNVTENAIILTPRMHLKYQFNDHIQARLSAGKGYRLMEMFWAENTYLLAMGRKIQESISQRESAWNFGGSLGFDIPLWGKNLKINAEYFYTTFGNQVVIDYDSDANKLLIYDLNSWNNGDGKSFSHVLQVDVTYEPLAGLSTTLAFRRNIVKTTYGGILRDKALSSKYKGLLTASYKPGLGLWQFDGSLQLNGPARLPKSALSDGTAYSSVYPQLSLQVTRWFRHFSVYLGGENLTDYRQKNAVIGWDNPFSTDFDATQVWAPVHGRMLYVGVRINLGKM